MNWVIIGSGNGLLPDWHPANTLINADIRSKFQWNVNQFTDIFSQENAFENVVC